MKKNQRIFPLSILLVAFMAGITVTLAKTSETTYQCRKVLICSPSGGSPGGETGPNHYYCSNPSVIGMEYCYAHWGEPEHPCPY